MTMGTYLSAAIKEVITEFPHVGTILAEYDVGCVTCQVGTCLLGDVVSIHGLAPEAERTLMARIAEAVAPGGISTDAASRDAQTRVTPPARTPGVEKKEVKYSPPLKQLVDEHVLIKRLVAAVPGVLQMVDVGVAEDRQVLLDAVDFVRSYADAFHHAKEEDILFTYFDSSLAMIQVMLADHETARAHVRRVAEAVEQQDGDTVAEHLGAYGRLLTAHIQREDEILYPWMDGELTTAEVGELFSRFAAVDQAAGQGFTERYTGLVAEIERWVESKKPLTREVPALKVEV
jgi:hemerythrin-like domain-containing protein